MVDVLRAMRDTGDRLGASGPGEDRPRHLARGPKHRDRTTDPTCISECAPRSTAMFVGSVRCANQDLNTSDQQSIAFEKGLGLPLDALQASFHLKCFDWAMQVDLQAIKLLCSPVGLRIRPNCAAMMESGGFRLLQQPDQCIQLFIAHP
ncbi:hypothetical protein V5F77_19540 [Xanthobacter sp. DSM 24535]|uniref:hypothetical protein n=1 Tax=Roseixanthobacter psychrophilus TaxID=3119917 RepID=UPI00372CB73D